MGYACGQTSEMACNVVDNCMLRELQLEENDIPGAKLVKDPSECNLEELTRWLECRGQKISGKKVELVERVLGCLRLNFPPDPKVDKLQLETRNFNYGHIYNYLIEPVSDVYVNVSVTKESNDEDECSESQGTVA